MSTPRVIKTVYLTVEDYNKAEKVIINKKIKGYSNLMAWLLAQVSLSED